MRAGESIVTEDRRINDSIRDLNYIPEWKRLRPKQKRFLAALVRENLCVTKASTRSGVDWRRHYYWLKYPEYVQGLVMVDKIVGNALLATMLGDAVNGREIAITYQGKVTGYRREIFPQERIKLLAGLDRRFADNQQFNVSGPAQINIGYSSRPDQPSIDVTPTEAEQLKILGS